MTLKGWHAAVAMGVGGLAILAAFGFMSPSARADKTEKSVSALTEKVDRTVERVNGHDVDIVGMKKDIDYAARGIEALLLEKGLTPSPRRRGR